MHNNTITRQGKVWIWQKNTTSPQRYFVSIPPGTPGLWTLYMYKSAHPTCKGMIPVQACIAYYTRNTRLFTDKESASYILPLKKSVREELHIQEGTTLSVQCSILT